VAPRICLIENHATKSKEQTTHKEQLKTTLKLHLNMKLKLHSFLMQIEEEFSIILPC
jgi:hypothetical protein